MDLSTLSKQQLIDEAVKCGYPKVLCETAKSKQILIDLINEKQNQPPLTPIPSQPASEEIKFNPQPLPQEEFDKREAKQKFPISLLPTPVKDYLVKHWGNWLNFFEIGWEERQDFEGGRAMFVKVPREYSVSWKEDTVPVWDNKTQRQKLDEHGNPMFKKVITEDIRWRTMKDTPELIRWLQQVKEKILNDCFKAGITPPNTMTAYDDAKKSIDDFKKSVHS